MDEWMRCELEEQMSAYMSLALDNMLDVGERQELDRHLATCSDCQAEWEGIKQISMLFDSAPMIGPSLGFAVRVERSIGEKAQKRRRNMGQVALLTGSLSFAGLAAAAISLVVVAFVAWQWLGGVPSVQLGSSAVSQIASGFGLMGKGVSMFLKDLLVRYGPPLLAALAVGLAAMVSAWAWVYTKRPGSSSRHNGIA